MMALVFVVGKVSGLVFGIRKAAINLGQVSRGSMMASTQPPTLVWCDARMALDDLA
jgi:hypothetical protein